MGWLSESNRMVSVDNEVRCIDIVTFEHHLEDLWLMHCSLLHKLNDLVLLCNGMVHVMVKLGLNFVLELSCFRQEVLVLSWDSKVLSVLSEEVELADMCPGIVPVTHWVHGPDPNILSTSEQIHLMNFLIE